MKGVVNTGGLVDHLKSSKPLEVTLDGNESWMSMNSDQGAE